MSHVKCEEVGHKIEWNFIKVEEEEEEVWKESEVEVTRLNERS